jgi:hypothetical protein
VRRSRAQRTSFARKAEAFVWDPADRHLADPEAPTDFRDTPDEAAFRAELRDWLRDNRPPEWDPDGDPRPHLIAHGTEEQNGSTARTSLDGCEAHGQGRGPLLGGLRRWHGSGSGRR